MITTLPATIDYAAPLPALPAADLERAANFARQDKSPATRAAHKSDFAAFQAWCNTRGVASLPASPETVAVFLAAEAEAGLKPSTIGRRGAAIRYAHKLAGHEPPTNSEAVKATLRDNRRTKGVAPARKAPAVAETLSDMARAAPDRIKGLRDRALLLLGFGGAFRRSELVALDVADLEETEDGLRAESGAMILTVRLLPKEARALAEMCRRFRFDDAQQLLTGTRNVTPTNLWRGGHVRPERLERGQPVAGADRSRPARGRRIRYGRDDRLCGREARTRQTPALPRNATCDDAGAMRTPAPGAFFQVFHLEHLTDAPGERSLHLPPIQSAAHLCSLIMCGGG